MSETDWVEHGQREKPVWTEESVECNHLKTQVCFLQELQIFQENPENYSFRQMLSADTLNNL